jgi:hypothetical protein
MRVIPLTVVRGGINRQRTKGGAPADSLYELLNGYVTAAGTMVARPGTYRESTLHPATRGLVAFDGSRHVFCHSQVEVPDGYTLHVLHHPESTDGYTIELERIHFAAPMMGALYVAAEFEDGQTFHYWLQQVDVWTQDTQYLHGAMVRPSVPTGLVYQASRLGQPYPAWAPDVPRSDGNINDYGQSIIEPTVYNDFFYECVLTGGDNPRSGTTEPTWPTEAGAQIIEYADGGDDVTQPAPPEPPSTDTPQEDVRERYARILAAAVGIR